MKFFRSPIFYITVLIQIAGPFFFSFGDWANVIQYLSGYGMAYAVWHYIHVHRKEIQFYKQHIHDLMKERK